MKVVIYSSNSNYFNGNIFHYFNYPSNKSLWESFLEKHPDYELIFVTQLPGMFLLDLETNSNNEIVVSQSKKIQYFIQKPSADFIKNLNPDLVISATFWVTPFDWLTISDGIIAEELKDAGIKVIANSQKTGMLCFDKNLTHNFLQENGFNIAKAVYVHHELFWAERNRSEIETNVYKESVFNQIRKLKLPLVIKDTSGLSSYGMEVVKTHNQAIGFLNSKKNSGDKLVEEFIEGLQFGTEIHGTKDKGYFIFDPFLFSVNQYGITSPKQSIKLGPINSPKFKIDNLKKELNRLAEKLEINGVAQVDLVFGKDKSSDEYKWYIIEINPRLSGMTQTLYESKNKETVMALKLPHLTNEQLEKLKNLTFVKHISQVINDAAKQRRECGYCEIIFSYQGDGKELIELKSKFPELIDEGFYKQALDMTKILLN